MSQQPSSPCSVCRLPSVAKGLCDKHYRRWKKFGSTAATLRPDDWGQREKHPLRQLWDWTGRAPQGRVKRWNDLWSFVADVGERPTGMRLRRYDPKRPWGPDNFYWKEPLTGGDYTTTNAEGRKRYQREWRAKNRLRSKSNDLKKSYGICIERYHEMLEAQDGKCAICKADARLAVDHCHVSGTVRGLLCHKCNRALGLFNDNAESLRAAAAYLESETILRL
jgi:hypothetical protein